VDPERAVHDTFRSCAQPCVLLAPLVRAQAVVYEYGCQVPSGIFSGGANRSRRRPRAASPSPPCSSTSPTGDRLGRRAVSQAASARLACPSVRAPGPNNRLSVGDLPPSPAPSAVSASSARHAPSKRPPLERTVPSQVHPAAPRRLSPTALDSPLSASDQASFCPGVLRCGPRGTATPDASAAAAFAGRRAVGSTRRRQSF